METEWYYILFKLIIGSDLSILERMLQSGSSPKISPSTSMNEMNYFDVDWKPPLTTPTPTERKYSDVEIQTMEQVVDTQHDTLAQSTQTNEVYYVVSYRTTRMHPLDKDKILGLFSSIEMAQQMKHEFMEKYETAMDYKTYNCWISETWFTPDNYKQIIMDCLDKEIMDE